MEALEIRGTCDPGFAEEKRMSFSYLMNRMGSTAMGDTRAFGRAAALYGAL